MLIKAKAALSGNEICIIHHKNAYDVTDWHHMPARPIQAFIP